VEKDLRAVRLDIRRSSRELHVIEYDQLPDLRSPPLRTTSSSHLELERAPLHPCADADSTSRRARDRHERSFSPAMAVEFVGARATDRARAAVSEREPG
jgi:hypothetical protein